MRAAALGAVLLSVSAPALAEEFSYRDPGDLAAGSGRGRVDFAVYAPNIRFPIEAAPAYANSQVWGRGGSHGSGGSQCDVQNFAYPWHDNYCETRDWEMPLCPAGEGHQGQDIRAASCMAGVHWAVAVTDGRITSIGSYTVYLTAADGTRYDYLHMSDVTVQVGDRVTRGQRLGKVSNKFGDSSTTVHLHFNILQNVDGVGMVFVPPYVSLIESYRVLLGLSGEPDGPIALDAPAAPADAPRRDDAAAGMTSDASTGDMSAAGGTIGGGCALAGANDARPPFVLALVGVLWMRRRRSAAR